MFYNDPSYEMLSEKRIPSEGVPVSNPEKPLPEFWEIECRNIHILTECPDCHVPLSKKQTDAKTIYAFNQETNRIEKVTVFSQRYRCRKCKKTMHSELNIGNITRTRDFDEKICSLMLRDGYSSSVLAKQYHRSPKLISDITHSYTRDMMLTFTPPEGCKTLYLCPFMYQRKKRYYLGGVLNDKAYLLAFFGHVDAINELTRYFSFHENFVRASAGPDIVTDFDIYLISILKSILTDPVITFIPRLLEERLDEFAKDNGAALRTQYDKARAVNLLKSILLKKGTAKGLKKWRQMVECDPDIWRPLADLVSRMKDYETECLNSRNHYDTAALFADIDFEIQSCLSKNFSFDVLTARLMHQAYGEFATSEYAVDLFKTEENYDIETNTCYREPLVPIPIGDIKSPAPPEMPSRLFWDTFGVLPNVSAGPEDFDGKLPFDPYDDEDDRLPFGSYDEKEE